MKNAAKSVLLVLALVLGSNAEGKSSASIRFVPSSQDPFVGLAENRTDAVDYTLLWCSSGGGWRAMAADMGFAQNFAKLGLIREDGSDISGMAGASGGGWFMLQYFYSLPFYRRVSFSTPDSLADFVIQWMNAYYEIWPVDPPRNPRCDELAKFVKYVKNMEGLVDVCNNIAYFNSDWFTFVEVMLSAVATSYGDANLTKILATSQNKIAPLASTTLNLQTSVAPNSRSDGTNWTTYIGPKRTKAFLDRSVSKTSPGIASNVEASVAPRRKTTMTGPAVYTVMHPMQWTVLSNRFCNHLPGVSESWFPSDFFSSSQNMAYVTESHHSNGTFHLFEYRNFPLFPPKSTDALLTNINKVPGAIHARPLSDPLNGEIPSVGYIAAITSAAASRDSGGSPSVFAQEVSYFKKQLLDLNITQAEKTVGVALLQQVATFVWNSPHANDLSLCSQRGDRGETNLGCLPPALRFMDGGFTDGLSMAQTIGRYQQLGKGSEQLKVILTNTNYYTDSQQKILQYWSSEYNEGVAPGDFLWNGKADVATPRRSKQIFEEQLSNDAIIAALEPIAGTNLTTAVLNGTTTDNQAYSVKAGQKVSILLLEINSNIPTSIILRPEVEEWTVPLAELAEVIASNEELRRRVAYFLQK